MAHSTYEVAQHMNVLRVDPLNYDAYRALRDLYLGSQQYDKAWCVCRSLVFLRAASPDDLRFVEQYKPRGLTKAKNAISGASWAHLVHPAESRSISMTLAGAWPSAAAAKGVPHKRLGLKRKHRRELESDPLMLSKLLYYIVQVLCVPLPEVFLVEDDKGPIMQFVAALDGKQLIPSFLVRPHLLQGKTEMEVAFVLASRLVRMRPEYVLSMLLSDSELGALVQSSGAAAAHEVTGWLRAVDMLAHRAGLVVCGDLDAAGREIAPHDTPALVVFSVSEEYFAVRAQMGLTIAG